MQKLLLWTITWAYHLCSCFCFGPYLSCPSCAFCLIYRHPCPLHGAYISEHRKDANLWRGSIAARVEGSNAQLGSGHITEFCAAHLALLDLPKISQMSITFHPSFLLELPLWATQFGPVDTLFFCFFPHHHANKQHHLRFSFLCFFFFSFLSSSDNAPSSLLRLRSSRSACLAYKQKPNILSMPTAGHNQI